MVGYRQPISRGRSHNPSTVFVSSHYFLRPQSPHSHFIGISPSFSLPSVPSNVVIGSASPVAIADITENGVHADTPVDSTVEQVNPSVVEPSLLTCTSGSSNTSAESCAMTCPVQEFSSVLPAIVNPTTEELVNNNQNPEVSVSSSELVPSCDANGHVTNSIASCTSSLSSDQVVTCNTFHPSTDAHDNYTENILCPDETSLISATKNLSISVNNVKVESLDSSTNPPVTKCVDSEQISLDISSRNEITVDNISLQLTEESPSSDVKISLPSCLSDVVAHNNSNGDSSQRSLGRE